VDRHQLHQPREVVRQRQEQQHRVARPHQSLHRDHRLRHGREVAVREHAGLGQPGRAGGVEVREDIPGLDLIAPPGDGVGLAREQCAAARRKAGQRSVPLGLDHHRRRPVHRRRAPQLAGSLGHQHRYAAVADDVVDVVGRRRGIDGDKHRPD
jgi:hypothetical protein